MCQGADQELIARLEVLQNLVEFGHWGGARAFTEEVHAYSPETKNKCPVCNAISKCKEMQ